MAEGVARFDVFGANRIYSVTCLGSYHKYWIDRDRKIKNEKCDNYSRLILDLKDRRNRDFNFAVSYFSDLLVRHVGLRNIVGSVEVVVVPSSSQGKFSPGLAEISKIICAKFENFYYKDNSLERSRGIVKMATGGMRAYATHQNSLRFTPHKINPPLKLLLDDVSTSGNSMAAAIDYLISSDMRYNIIPIVLGKNA